MDLRQRKEYIETMLAEGDLETAKQLLDEYEKEYSEDIDVVSMKTSYNLLIGDLNAALELALLGVRRLPLNGDMLYNLAYVYELSGQKYEAYLYYEKAKYIYVYTQNKKINELGLEQKTDLLLQNLVDELDGEKDKQKIQKGKEMIEALSAMTRNSFGFREKAFRSCEKIIGKYFYENEFERRYVGIFKSWFLHEIGDDRNLDVVQTKAEFLKVREGMSIHYNNTEESAETQYLLPIASSEENTVHFFKKDGNKCPVEQYVSKHFNYYRIPNDIEVASTKKSYYGSPIPLRYVSGNKKLVLSIFVDGLSQYILKGENFTQKAARCLTAFGSA